MCKGYGLWLRYKVRKRYRVRGAVGYVIVRGNALAVGGRRSPL